MHDITIECRNVGKRYHIGQLRESRRNIDSLLLNSVTAPARRIRSLRRTLLPENAEKEIWALREITFDVYKGEIFGIIGANGSGKSTLLKIISHVVKPTEGYLLTRGRISTLLEVGTGFHEDLTGRENLYINGAIHGMSRQEMKQLFHDIVDFAEIEEFIDTPIKRYSTGMRLRLAFAISVFLRPEIMIFDEVLEVGDIAFREKCLAQINRFSADRSIVLVSHNLPQIRRLCNRVMWLNKGQIAEIGDTQSVVERFEERFLSKLSTLFNDVSHQRIEQFGEDRILLNEGWYRLENQGNIAFRWATNDAQIVICNISGKKRELSLDLEVGPAVGSESVLIAITDEDQGCMIGRNLVYRRQIVTFELPTTRQEKMRLRLQVDSSKNLPSPGDKRILNFRIFDFYWSG